MKYIAVEFVNNTMHLDCIIVLLSQLKCRLSPVWFEVTFLSVGDCTIILSSSPFH